MPHARPAASLLQGVDLRALAGALFRRGTFGLTSHLYQISLRTPHRPGARFLPFQRLPWLVFRGACGIPANAKKFFVALAAFLQRPKSFSWRLQHSCKVQKVFRGACSVPAKTKKFLEAFAAILQRPKSFSWHLQHSCKRFLF